MGAHLDLHYAHAQRYTQVFLPSVIISFFFFKFLCRSVGEKHLRRFQNAIFKFLRHSVAGILGLL